MLIVNGMTGHLARLGMAVRLVTPTVPYGLLSDEEPMNHRSQTTAPSFETLGLSQVTHVAVIGLGHETPSPVQAAAIPQLPFDDALAHTSPPVRGPARVRIATQGYDRRDRGAARATRLRTGKEQVDARLARTGGHQARHRALPRQAPRRQPLPAPAQGGVSAPPSMAIAAAPPMAPTPSHGHPSARRAAVTPATVAAGGDRSRSHGVFRPALWRCEDNWEGTLRLFARYLDIHRSALVSCQRFIRYE